VLQCISKCMPYCTVQRSRDLIHSVYTVYDHRGYLVIRTTHKQIALRYLEHCKENHAQ